MALGNETHDVSISLIDLFEHDTRIFESISSAITLNDFLFIRVKKNELAHKLAALWASKFTDLGASVLRASQFKNESGFEAFGSIADFSSHILSAPFVDGLKNEDDLVDNWDTIGLSNYHFKLYDAYTHLISTINRTANQNHMTYLIMDGLTFDDHITKNILSNLIKDLLSNSQHSVKMIMVIGEETTTLESTVGEFKKYLEAKSVHSIDYPLPLPSLENIRAAFENQYINHEQISTKLNLLSKQISNSKINSFDDAFFELLKSQKISFDHPTSDTSSVDHSTSYLFERLKPDQFFKATSHKLVENQELSVFEISRLVDFTYFYEYKHLVPLLKPLINHPSPVVKFSLLKPLQVFGTETIDSNQHIVNTIHSIFPWILNQSHASFCEDAFFTIFRCFLFTEDKRILEFTDTYLIHLRDINHINYEKLQSFYRFHTSNSEETKNDLQLFLEHERSSGYNFTVKRNTRFISLVSTAVEVLFFDHELVSYTEELAYLEEKINSISSPISNELIAKANLAEEYTHAGKFENARDIYLEISSVPLSMQIPNPGVFAQGSIYSLLISSGVAIPADDMVKIEDYGLQIKPCHTKALFYINSFLLGKPFNDADFNDLMMSFARDIGSDTKAVSWMLCPIILWQAEKSGVSVENRKKLQLALDSQFQGHEVDRLLCDLSFADKAEDVHSLISEILKQGLLRPNFKPLRRIFAFSMLSHYAARSSVSHPDLYVAVAKDYMMLTFLSWRNHRDSQAIISSELTNQIFSYLGSIDQNDHRTLIRVLDEYTRLERQITDPISHGMFITTSLMSYFDSKYICVRLFYKVNNSVRQSLEFIATKENGKYNISFSRSPENGALNVLTEQGFDFSVRASTARIGDKQRTIDITVDSRDSTSGRNLETLCSVLVEKSNFLDTLKKSHETFSAEFSCNEKLMHIDEQQKVSFTRQIEFQEAHSKRLHTVLNSLNVGVCSIVSAKLLLGDETNSYFGERFIKSNRQRDFKNCVLKRSTLSEEQIDLIVETLKSSIYEPSFILDLNMHHLPSEITCSTDEGLRTYEISWNFNTNSELIITEFIVVFTDVTDLRIRKQQEFISSRRAEIYAIFSDLTYSDARNFLESAKSLVKNIIDSLDPSKDFDRDHLKRELHTLKGISRSFLFNRLASLTHDAESALETLDESNLISVKANLINEYLQELIVIHDKLFKNRATDSGNESQAVKDLIRFIESKGLNDDPNFKIVQSHLGKESSYDFIYNLLSRTVQSRVSAQTPLITFDIKLDGEIRLTEDSKTIFFKTLPHLVANSLVHGFALSDQTSSKIANPKLYVSVVCKDKSYQVEYWDNGRGIDLDKLAELAVTSNYSYNSPSELCSIIFQSGISTRDKVEMDSGRGVGLNAVRADVKSFGGKFEIVLPDSTEFGSYQPFKFKFTIPS